MKLNQGLVLAAALVVGSLAVTGCSRSAAEDATDENATTEQASVTSDDGDTVQAVASSDEGFTQDARGFRGGRGEGWRHERPVRRNWWRFW